MSKKLVSKLFVLMFLLGTLGYFVLPAESVYASTQKTCTKDSDCPRGQFCRRVTQTFGYCEYIAAPCGPGPC